MCLWNDLANTFTKASEFFFSPFPLGTEFHSSLGEKAYKKFLLGCEYQLSICPTYDHRGTKKKKKNPFKYLVMFQGQTASIPGRMKQPHGHERH